MKISTALILCAGYGKRLNPLTLKVPKPLIELNQVTMLENSINLIENLDINEIIINTFYLRDQIKDFIKKKRFKNIIQIIDDGKHILDTEGYIKFNQSPKLIIFLFNQILCGKIPNNEIKKMEELYFQNHENILLLVNKNLSFDKDLHGDLIFVLKII